MSNQPQATDQKDNASTAAKALAAAGDAQTAADIGALDDAALAAQEKLGAHKRSLVERFIYGPTPNIEELLLQSDSKAAAEKCQGMVEAALNCLRKGEAFEADRALSSKLRAAVAKEKGYGYTVDVEFGGAGGSYPELAVAEEELSANGLGALAVEISGELTIGAGSLQAYGTDEQKKTFLPLVAEGQLMGFGLTEVKIGVNAKKIRAYVEYNESEGQYRLHATGDRSKLYITNAIHGSLVGIVARIGKDGKKVGLFVIQLPETDLVKGKGQDFGFACSSSGASAFASNHNSRLSFDNFPIPKSQEIQADGVEVLFYCLRMGRCMLAAMAAGYQRMFAADAANYGILRDGVGGKVLKHELPRLALGKMLGGALQSRSLSHLSLQQDSQGVDLAGLRDLTKSAASTTAMESLVACERVVGGRSFDKGSRISEARANMHVFGVVEGEDDLILMGMVKDITGAFVDQNLAGMLGILGAMNVDASGARVPREERILKISLPTMIKFPGRIFSAIGKLFKSPDFYRLNAWVLTTAIKDAFGALRTLVPASIDPRFACLPAKLRPFAKFAVRHLSRQRWVYLAVNTYYQLELTQCQMPLQRYGKRIEHLTSILALCAHAAKADDSSQVVAAVQAELLREKARNIKVVRAIPQMERLRGELAKLGKSIENGQCELIKGIEPGELAHPWDDMGKT